jgi:hypothetical protein
MTWSKPFTDAEIAYVEREFPKKSCATIASKLGRSKRGVEKLVNRLGLREPCAPPPARSKEDAHAREAACPPPAGEGPQDELSELRDIKRVLKRTLRDDIDPRDMPKISAELREVIKRISELEEGGGDGGGTMDRGAGNLVVTVPLRPA